MESLCHKETDSKIRAQEIFDDVSFVIFGHQTWDLEGISWFSSTPAGIGLRNKVSFCSPSPKDQPVEGNQDTLHLQKKKDSPVFSAPEKWWIDLSL